MSAPPATQKLTLARLESLPFSACDLFKQGVLVEIEDGGKWVFTQNRTFSSPSQAGGVVLGHGLNGRIVWKTANGETLKSLQIAAAGGRVDSEIAENK